MRRGREGRKVGMVRRRVRERMGEVEGERKKGRESKKTKHKRRGG